MRNRELESKIIGKIGSQYFFRNWYLLEFECQLGLSSTEIADELGINHEIYIQYVNLRQYPKKQTQQKICDYFSKKGLDANPEDIFCSVLYKLSYDPPDINFIPHENIDEIELKDNSEKQKIILELKEDIDRALDTLTAKEADIIIKKFGLDSDPMTYEAIAKEYNVTKQAIQQHCQKGIRRLRHASRSRKLRSYLRI